VNERAVKLSENFGLRPEGRVDSFNKRPVPHRAKILPKFGAALKHEVGIENGHRPLLPVTVNAGEFPQFRWYQRQAG